MSTFRRLPACGGVEVLALIAQALRSVGRRLLPPPPLSVMDEIIRRDARSDTFFRAIDYLNYESVPGDIVECGVFGGLSLAQFAKGMTFDSKGHARRIVGIDSFEGLPAASETHARWKAGDCALSHGWHPLAAPGQPVSAALVRELFRRCELPPPILHVGRFTDVMPPLVLGDLRRIALLHVDCDLYESTRDALALAAPALQDGAMVLFDDWFHYKGHPDKGEARAFAEFLRTHPEWHAVPWRSYATFCQAFILVRR
jgi:hypothetical protein